MVCPGQCCCLLHPSCPPTVDADNATPCSAPCHADVKAAEHFMQFQYGWIADPLYFGDYPKIMRDTQVRI